MEDEDRNWGFSCGLYVDVYLFITVVLTHNTALSSRYACIYTYKILYDI